MPHKGGTSKAHHQPGIAHRRPPRRPPPNHAGQAIQPTAPRKAEQRAPFQALGTPELEHAHDPTDHAQRKRIHLPTLLVAVLRAATAEPREDRAAPSNELHSKHS